MSHSQAGGGSLGVATLVAGAIMFFGVFAFAPLSGMVGVLIPALLACVVMAVARQ